jgi:nicotinamide-nucleotide amidase
MRAIIISIGTELTTGQTVDTNSAWLSARLAEVGVEVVRHVTVADDPAALTKEFRERRRGVDLLIATGGLGPTADDLTRQAFAAAIDRPLREHPDGLRQVEAFFARLERPMSPANRVQALIPEGADVIPNPRGTAPGIRYRDALGRCYLLPGVPAELYAMYEQSVVTDIRRETGGTCFVSDRLECFGMTEARIGERLADLMARGRNPNVGTTASRGVISVRVVARGSDRPEAERLLHLDLDEVSRRLGTIVFGRPGSTLQAAVADLLIGVRRTIAVAESCTGGLLAARLTDVPGSSAYFLEGFVTYANEAKHRRLGVPRALITQHGTVSEPVARAMAEGCRAVTGGDYALAITGIAGPGGGSADKPVGLVFLALARSSGTEVRRVLFGEHLSREDIRDRACKTALNMLRLDLLVQSA